MVGIVNRIINLTFIALQIGTDHDIVKAEIEMVQVVGNAQTKSGFCKSIFQMLTYDVMRVGHWRVIEITHHNDVRMPTFCHCLCYDIGLRSTFRRFLSQFLSK